MSMKRCILDLQKLLKDKNPLIPVPAAEIHQLNYEIDQIKKSLENMDLMGQILMINKFSMMEDRSIRDNKITVVQSENKTSSEIMNVRLSRIIHLVKMNNELWVDIKKNNIEREILKRLTDDFSNESKILLRNWSCKDDIYKQIDILIDYNLDSNFKKVRIFNSKEWVKFQEYKNKSKIKMDIGCNSFRGHSGYFDGRTYLYQDVVHVIDTEIDSIIVPLHSRNLLGKDDFLESYLLIAKGDIIVNVLHYAKDRGEIVTENRYWVHPGSDRYYHKHLLLCNDKLVIYFKGINSYRHNHSIILIDLTTMIPKNLCADLCRCGLFDQIENMEMWEIRDENVINVMVDILQKMLVMIAIPCVRMICEYL
ncbi:MAG: hypothetical protein Harvfovirus1_89 [Harvfovirus sp.]|uniref:Uncharacterized protein n=1 Tax=Harvfovirus sp. TaxID=2487768 RepID=A0A3G5A1T4_9VIRU|nr:MAG: hypothetical protein Harvfovirus1_89 [Harvfovirus sp.]